MNYLYENGTRLCEVANLVHIPGVARRQTESSMGGGFAQLSGRTTPDRVRFSSTVIPNVSSGASHELRDETGQLAPILSERWGGDISNISVTAILL